MSKKQSLAQRTISSISWNFIGNGIRIVVGLVRSVLLARLLPIETFGVYAWAHSVVILSAILPNFGLGPAFLHRAPETKDEEQAARVHFTLHLLLTSIWAVVMILVAVTLIKDDARRLALLWITSITFGIRLTATPRLLMTRRVVHRRLSLIQITDTVFSSIVALGLALQGVSLWALLATDLATFLVSIVGFYVWRPVWRPRVSWQPEVMRYFMSFGSRNFIAGALQYVLDRIDDLWVGSYLGNTAMGLYSRAYTFAIYPRRFLAAPIQSVSTGTYSELKDDRKRLSQAFFRINAFLIRSGFLIAGLFALVAPEFIRQLLGAKWLPMLSAFRLMLIYTMFDPFKLTVANVLVAVGQPEKIARIRFIQLAVLLAGLFLLGPSWDIAGVALAVDAMLVVGIVALLWQVRTHVDFSFTRLFVAPVLALGIAMVLARQAILLPGVLGSDWRAGAIKAIVFVALYGAVLLIFERRELSRMMLLVTKYLRIEHGRS